MCPDRQIISVYFDNELESPWKEKLESHIASCPECRARLESYNADRKLLSGGRAAADAAKDRVWAGLEPRLGPEAKQKQSMARGFWNGSIRIPFPAAAAAGIALAAAFAAFAAVRPQNTPLPQLAGVGMEVQASPDMETLLEYLNNDSSAEMVIIRLPETATFKSAGEPRVIRAADYPRSGAGR